MSYTAVLTGAGYVVNPIINPKSGTPSSPYIATLGPQGWAVSPIVKPVAPPSRGPERLANNDFAAAGTGWTVGGTDVTHIITFGTGSMRFQSDTTSPQLNVSQSGILTVGKSYELIINVAAYASGLMKTDAFALGNFINRAGEIKVTATAVTTNFNLTRGGTGVDITVSSISIKEVLS